MIYTSKRSHEDEVHDDKDMMGRLIYLYTHVHTLYLHMEALLSFLLSHSTVRRENDFLD